MGVSVPAIRECNITCLSLQYVHKEQEDEGRKRYEEQKLDRLETKQRNGDVILPVINPGNEAGVSNCRLEQMVTVGLGPAAGGGLSWGTEPGFCSSVLPCCCVLGAAGPGMGRAGTYSSSMARGTDPRAQPGLQMDVRGWNWVALAVMNNAGCLNAFSSLLLMLTDRQTKGKAVARCAVGNTFEVGCEVG